MPTWLIATLVAAAAVGVALWADEKMTIVITELRAMREDLDKLWGDRVEEEVVSPVEVNQPHG